MSCVSVVYYEEHSRVRKTEPKKKSVASLVNFPGVFCVREPNSDYYVTHQAIVISSWRVMIEELEKEGYSISQVSRVTGVSRRTVQRWFNGTEEIPGYLVFSKVLHLYCYSKKRSKPT